MPSFGKFNYAICRRMSKAAFFANYSNSTDTNGNGNLPTNGTNGLEKQKANKDKKKSKKDKEKEKKKQNNSKINNDSTISADDYEQQAIMYEKANEELNNFIATLRMLNVDVVELCPDEDLSYESVFAGDTAVTINGLVLLCRPRNRLKEIEDVMQFIKSELNLPIIEINDESAHLNGGDVLWTGREIFVGLSNETNESGARAVAAAFPEYPVTPVKVPTKKNLRLKSYVTMAGPDILCVNKSQDAQTILRRMEREASHNYKLITVEDNQASNVLYLNGTLLHRNDCLSSVSVLQEKIDFPRVPIKITELCRNYPFHGLDSFCILIRKSHRIQTIV